jgi:hypothetical protein
MKRFLVFGILIFLALSIPLLAQTAQKDVKLAWDTNPTTPIVAKYTIYQHVGTVYTKLADVLPTACTAGTCSYTIPNQTPGVYQYVVTASAGQWGESGYSNEVATDPPGAVPRNVTISIIITIK